MYQALETHPARVFDMRDADLVFLDVETAQERNWPRMHAGAGTANIGVEINQCRVHKVISQR